MGGAEIFLATSGRAVGDRGLVKGLTRASFRAPAGLCSGLSIFPEGSLSSGKGPKVDPPEAELIPDMAETESPDLFRDLTKLAWICW